ASASILIKADPTGYFIQQLYSTPDGFGNPSILGALTGTIVRAPEPTSTAPGIAFSASGPTTFADPIQPPVYTLQGTISSATAQPGGSLRVQGTLRVWSSTGLPSASPIMATVRIALERLTGPDGTGNQTQSTLSSTTMTPTGLPIDRTGPLIPPDLPALGQDANYTLSKVASDRAEATVDITLPIS